MKRVHPWGDLSRSDKLRLSQGGSQAAMLCWSFTFSSFFLALFLLSEMNTIGRLRERTKRDESDSGDRSGNVSDAGLDLTGSGHSSRQVQGLWLARPIESDLVRNALSHAQSSPIWYENALKTSSQVLGWVGFSRTFLSFDFFSVLHIILFFSLIMPIAVLVSSLQKTESL